MRERSSGNFAASSGSSAPRCLVLPPASHDRGVSAREDHDGSEQEVQRERLGEQDEREDDGGDLPHRGDERSDGAVEGLDQVEDALGTEVRAHVAEKHKCQEHGVVHDKVDRCTHAPAQDEEARAREDGEHLHEQDHLLLRRVVLAKRKCLLHHEDRGVTHERQRNARQTLAALAPLREPVRLGHGAERNRRDARRDVGDRLRAVLAARLAVERHGGQTHHDQHTAEPLRRRRLLLALEQHHTRGHHPQQLAALEHDLRDVVQVQNRLVRHVLRRRDQPAQQCVHPERALGAVREQLRNARPLALVALREVPARGRGRVHTPAVHQRDAADNQALHHRQRFDVHEALHVEDLLLQEGLQAVEEEHVHRNHAQHPPTPVQGRRRAVGGVVLLRHPDHLVRRLLARGERVLRRRVHAVREAHQRLLVRRRHALQRAEAGGPVAGGLAAAGRAAVRHGVVGCVHAEGVGRREVGAVLGGAGIRLRLLLPVLQDVAHADGEVLVLVRDLGDVLDLLLDGQRRQRRLRVLGTTLVVRAGRTAQHLPDVVDDGAGASLDVLVLNEEHLRLLAVPTLHVVRAVLRDHLVQALQTLAVHVRVGGHRLRHVVPLDEGLLQEALDLVVLHVHLLAVGQHEVALAVELLRHKRVDDGAAVDDDQRVHNRHLAQVRKRQPVLEQLLGRDTDADVLRRLVRPRVEHALHVHGGVREEAQRQRQGLRRDHAEVAAREERLQGGAALPLLRDDEHPALHLGRAGDTVAHRLRCA
eukprot:Rhum_TRINITY_DN14364_c9_g1::Rhum_TRINITY_DN14364_c9_g1_i1::g.85500::m.85500